MAFISRILKRAIVSDTLYHKSPVLKDKYSCILGVIILICNNPVTPLIRAPDKWGY